MAFLIFFSAGSASARLTARLTDEDNIGAGSRFGIKNTMKIRLGTKDFHGILTP